MEKEKIWRSTRFESKKKEPRVAIKEPEPEPEPEPVKEETKKAEEAEE